MRITTPSKVFAIGSLPIIRIGNLRDQSSEAWLPISSDIAVGMGNTRGREVLILLDDPQMIEAFNRATAVQSSSFAAASKPLIESLAAHVTALNTRSLSPERLT
jgi:hypothetical protein